MKSRCFEIPSRARSVPVLALIATLVATTPWASGCRHERAAAAGGTPLARPVSGSSQSAATVELAESQLNAIRIEPVCKHLFPVEREAVGSIDYDEDLSVHVFPPYQGRILRTFAELGEAVQRGDPLYSIESPDLIQAESTLIGAEATFDLSRKELARVQKLFASHGGLSQKDLDQAVAGEQTAQGALRAARDAVRVFGKTEDEIDRIVASRQIDPALMVRSPISGWITSRYAQPGLLVQPGTLPAPFSVADLSTKWMLADVVESDIPVLQAGQPVEAQVSAYPDRVFDGKISRIATDVDPNTHRVTVRSEVADPNNELRPGMFANFVIQVRPPEDSIGIPANGVVREGDGTMTAWVTKDRRHFLQATVQTGLRENGRVQILGGLTVGELVVTDGAIFLDNMLQAPPGD